MEAESGLAADANQVSGGEAVGGRGRLGDVLGPELAGLRQAAQLIEAVEAALVGLCGMFSHPGAHLLGPAPLRARRPASEQLPRISLEQVEIPCPARQCEEL